MQQFESFRRIFIFFLKSHFVQSYVSDIDISILNNTIDDETKAMVQQVRDFHKMRHDLCSKIFMYIENDNLLNLLVTARGLEQFDLVPINSTCCISGMTLSPKMGILLYVYAPTRRCIVVHRRYKQLLYNFWYLVHFTDEIVSDVSKLTHSKMYLNGKINAANIEQYDGLFVKQAYVKLKNITKYIQSDMSDLPINRRDNK
tara:strand:+ start:538 stop:1140 length:603 start_codon:yes stop_codon:yes gene_type:complete